MPRRSTTVPTLQLSLELYEQHLRALIEQDKEAFLALADARYIGCFCEPDQDCHIDVILRLLKELLGKDQNRSLPLRQCLRVKYLRPHWRDLKAYNKDPANVAAVRAGRIFRIGRNGKKKRYAYPASPWCNPYRIAAPPKTK